MNAKTDAIHSDPTLPDFKGAGWGRGGHITSRVIALLGCSATELERWCDDGRLREWGWVRISLPHTSKKVDARVWGLPDLLVAAHLMEDWRVLDRKNGKRPSTGKPAERVDESAIAAAEGIPSSHALRMSLDDAIGLVVQAARAKGVSLSTRQVWLTLAELQGRYGRMPAPRTVSAALAKRVAPPRLAEAKSTKSALVSALREGGLSRVTCAATQEGHLRWNGILRLPISRHGTVIHANVPITGVASSNSSTGTGDVAVDPDTIALAGHHMRDAARKMSQTFEWSFDKGLAALTGAGLKPPEAMRILDKEFSKIAEQPLFGSHITFGRNLDALLAQVHAKTVRPRLGERIRASCGFAKFPDLYPMARSMGRRHLVLVGPTNSGKTHKALESVREASSAVVLSPLRLLALEHMETMRAAGLPAGLLTGEEADIPDGTTHLAQTIETMDSGRKVDVAVIDEGQMLCDRERGWAWTRAITGVPAELIITTGTPEIAPHVQRLAALCGEPCEVVHLERLGSLEAMGSPVPFLSIRAGDAVVAFSRRDVLQLRDRLQSVGITAAAIYGGLGPEVRRAEAERFRSGQAKVIVATDAIGMGLNLPVRRVVLTDVTKFDGVKVRRLSFPEARQILGRAGRHGLAESGFAGAMTANGLDFVRTVLDTPAAPLKLPRFPVRPDVATVEMVAEAIGTKSLAKVLAYLRDHMTAGSKDFVSGDLTEMLARSAMFDRMGLRMAEKYAYAACPFQDDSLHQVQAWARRHASGETNGFPGEEVYGRLQNLEASSKLLSTYLWLARRFPESYPEADGATKRRTLVDATILRVLTSGKPAWEVRAPTRHWRDWEDDDGYFDDDEDDAHYPSEPSPKDALPDTERSLAKAAKKRAKRQRRSARKKERSRLEQEAAAKGAAPAAEGLECSTGH
jgi:hypothetical protein